MNTLILQLRIYIAKEISETKLNNNKKKRKKHAKQRERELEKETYGKKNTGK